MKSATKVKRRSKINCPDCFIAIKVKRKDLIFACVCGCVIEVVETVNVNNIVVKINGATCIPVSEEEFTMEVKT